MAKLGPPVYLQSILILNLQLILLATQATLAKTTSLPTSALHAQKQRTQFSQPQAELAPHSAALARQPELSGAMGSQEADAAIQMALVSARGALALWRPVDADLSTAYPFGASNSMLIRPPHSKCPQLAKLADQLAPSRQQKQQQQQQRQADSPELAAVEGTSVKLNLVIVGHRLVGEQGDQRAPFPRLKLHWTRNGSPLAVNSARGHFSQQVITSDNELARQLVGRPSPLTQSLYLAHNGSLAKLADGSQLGSEPPVNFGADRFMLSPHVNEHMLGRLAANLQESQTIQTVLGLSRRLRQPTNLVDDFLADASPQTIDWPKLEAFLRFNGDQLGLQLEPSSSGHQEPRECPRVQLEQLMVVQVEFNQLRMQDAGLYTLFACKSQQTELKPQTWACQQTSFNLQVVEDVPRLESKPSYQVLEVGDKLSIKCEATGFTLPQITWFLDGQQLNEHQLAQDSSSLSDESQAANSKLRIGDYVSQDNHVHSFVNSSSVRLTDGGFYKCLANNGFHTVEHESRVDVRGWPVIARQLNNMSVLHGQGQLQIQCPYSGFPVASIEWLYKPATAAAAAPSRQADTSSLASEREMRLMGEMDEQNYGRQARSSSLLREKRRPPSDLQAWKAGGLLEGPSKLDNDDPDKDEWLSQASAMTPSGPEDYPDPLPDYPSSGLGPPALAYEELAVALDSLGPPADYSDLQTDYQQQPRQQQQQQQQPPRKKRDTLGWVKYPQSRRHQVHSNGTLTILEVSRSDQGLYKCQALAHTQQETAGGPRAKLRIASSNEFHLTVLVPPVISPFSSADSLREGMRNFLTCSVIEGDSPIRLSWLKDGQPIEQYIQGTEEPDETAWGQRQQQQQRQARIRVEASNEFTSTLYFSHVDFKDNGNYSCLATNKAASVNYTAKMLVNVAPKWIKAPKDVECVSGQNIVIDCQAKAHPNPRVWWEIGIYSASPSETHQSGQSSQAAPTMVAAASKSKSETDAVAPAAADSSAGQQALKVTTQHQYAPNHYRTITSNSRIHILENASLVIRDVSKSDQGYYLCQAANNFGSLSSLMKLTVNVGASFQNKYLVKHVKLGDRIELDCDPMGQSLVEISWFMRNQAQSQHLVNQSQASGQSYKSAHNFTHIDPSTYRPQSLLRPQTPAAENHGRRLFIGTIRPDLYHHESSESQDASNLSNHGHLSRATTSDWESQLEPHFVDLDPSMSFELLKRADGQGEFVRLVLSQAKRMHSAEFVCQASNRYGSDEKLIKLLVQEPPDPVVEINAVQVSSRSVSITWLAPYNGNGLISSYTVEWTPVGSQSSNGGSEPVWSRLIAQQPAATIAPLQPTTSYEIRVRAHNQFGQSHIAPNATPILVTTIEEAPSSPPSDIRAIPLSSSSIQLTWLPPLFNSEQLDASGLKLAKFSIKGYYLGYKIAGSNDSFIFKTVSLFDHPLNLQNHEHLLATPETLLHNSSLQLRANGTTSDKTTEQQRLRVVIGDLRRSTKYAIIVQAYNSAGPGPQSDQVEAKTLLSDPPPAPVLRVSLVTYTSIELQWTFQLEQTNQADSIAPISGQPKVAFESRPADEQVLTSVDGYHLYYRSAEGHWMERKLAPETHSMIATGHQRNDFTIVEFETANSSSEKQVHASSWYKNSTSLATKSFRFTLDQLGCGNPYQIYLVAYNSIGAGLPSQIIRTKTRGSAPIGPRKQDYIMVNSTFAQLNLDSWMDGGCSISNFEIKYKQLNGGRPSASDTQSQWLLLSSNISPDKRIVEIRDLQPETWYSLLTIAESAAGRTELQNTFMTLDRFGQVPMEAIEPSNLPALFRGKSSIRSIFQQLSSGGGQASALVLSACMCLIIFATCSLFLVRRYNNHMKDNNSIDSQNTGGALTSPYQGPLLDHHDLGPKMVSSYQNGYKGQEHYSLRASPCKTATTLVTNSSSSGSHAMISGCGDNSNYRSTDQSLDLSQFLNRPIGDTHTCFNSRFRSPNITQEQQAREEFCSAAACESPLTGDKFSTIPQEDLDHAQTQSNRFKTMPHSLRPVSTFLQNGTCRGAIGPIGYTCNSNQHQLGSDDYNHQQQLADQQQIYTKLRLIYNNNSNYNICSDGQKEVLNDAASQSMHTGDNMDSSVLPQQQQQLNHKVLACSIKRGTQQNDIYMNNSFNVQGQNELTSLLLDCEQQQQQMMDTSSCLTGYQTNTQQVAANQPSGPLIANIEYSTNGTASIASGSSGHQSIGSSSQPTNSSSISTNHIQPDQLTNFQISGDGQAGSVTSQCPKAHSMKFNGNLGVCGVKQNICQQPDQTSNEQNNYALPFQPKWV